MNQPLTTSLRLLFVTPRYLPFQGGVENHVREVASRLATRGVDVTVLTTDPGGDLPSEEWDSGVRIWRLRAYPSKSDLHIAPGILSVVEQGDWDIVHCQSYHTFVAPLAMTGALRARRPYVVTFHGGGHSSALRNAIRRPQHLALRPLLARADRLIAVASFEIDFFGKRLHLSPEHFALIPNGADLGPQIPPGDVERNGITLLSVGRLEKYKGHQRVIAAMPHLIQQFPDIRLRIAGAGPYEFELRRLSEQHGVSCRVEIGAVPGSDRQAMAQLMREATLLVLLSEYETHPLAVIEALALERPAVVAATSGLTELADKGLVRAIPLRSKPSDVAMAIAQQIRQPLIPAKVAFPTWDECTDRLLTLYEEVLAYRSTRAA